MKKAFLSSKHYLLLTLATYLLAAAFSLLYLYSALSYHLLNGSYNNLPLQVFEAALTFLALLITVLSFAKSLSLSKHQVFAGRLISLIILGPVLLYLLVAPLLIR